MNDIEKSIIDKFKLPVRYDNEGQFITDQAGNIVCEVRGWGLLHKLSNNPEEIQDALGEMIAKAFNDKYDWIDWDNLKFGQEIPFTHNGSKMKMKFYRYVGEDIHGVVTESPFSPEKAFGLGEDVYLGKHVHKEAWLKARA